jgi:hypothetical protein
MKRIIVTERPLFLADLKDKTPETLRAHIITEYQPRPELVDKFDVLVAYEHVGDYGCDSTSWFLLREKTTGALFEVHGSHCSCTGFEGQFKPELTSRSYLLSDKFTFYCGGYDDYDQLHKAAVKRWLTKNL